MKGEKKINLIHTGTRKGVYFLQYWSHKNDTKLYIEKRKENLTNYTM